MTELGTHSPRGLSTTWEDPDELDSDSESSSSTESERSISSTSEESSESSEGEQQIDIYQFYEEDEDEISCRICRIDEPKEQLITPCKCNGTIAFVHRDCLLRWITYRSRSVLLQQNGQYQRCELCGTQ